MNGLAEDDVSAKLITPAIVKAGWDEATQIRRQVSFTKGRIIVRGRLVSLGKAKKADFVLYWQRRSKLGHHHAFARASAFRAFISSATAAGARSRRMMRWKASPQIWL